MKYAIVESGGKQYKAVEGGTLEVDRLPVETGAAVKLEQILLLADGGTITIGTPHVKDSPVWTKVLEHFKGEKVTIFNYSPKKRIRVKTGHRQNYTRLLVEQIGGTELVVREPVKKVKKLVEAEAESPEVKAEKPAKAAPKSAAASTTEKKPAAKAQAKAKKASVTQAKAAPAKAAAKKPAKAAPARAAEKKSPKAAPKPAARKTTTKKSSKAEK